MLGEGRDETAGTKVRVARQPIFDRDLNVVGYELLYRAQGSDEAALFEDPDLATIQVMLNAFLEIGLNRVVGQYPAYINLTRNFFVGRIPIPLPPERVVLEVLESVVVDEKVLSSLRQLSAQGYRIALDDFVWEDCPAELVEIADIVKLDIQALSAEEVERHVRLLRGRQIKLTAEKVETQEEFARCKALGFDFFQGYFLCVPNVVEGTRIQADHLTSLEILARLEDPHASLDDLSELLRRDVVLGYKLMRLINSLNTAFHPQVETIRQAASVLGVRGVRNWLTLLSIGGSGGPPRQLTKRSLVRAKMCECLATRQGAGSVEKFYTVGLFSVLATLVGLPMEQVVQDLPLADDIRQALVSHEGVMGGALKCVIAYETQRWREVHWMGLGRMEMNAAFDEAVAWVEHCERQTAVLV